MGDQIVLEAMNTGNRYDNGVVYRELILLYEDGTWEKIFKTEAHCNLGCIGVEHMRGKTRRQIIEKVEKLYYSGKLEGKFLI